MMRLCRYLEAMSTWPGNNRDLVLEPHASSADMAPFRVIAEFVCSRVPTIPTDKMVRMP